MRFVLVDRIVELDMTAFIRFVLIRVKGGLKPDVPPRNIQPTGNRQSAFDRSVVQLILAQRELDEWQ